ncbi:MAG: hypothetical protein ACE5EW_02165 [Thermoplasmata archaeon]
MVPHADGVEIRQADMLPIKEFCAAREGNYVGVLAAKGLRVEVEEGRCEVDGDDYCGFRIRVKGPLEAETAG